jgi:hypothetical protein
MKRGEQHVEAAKKGLLRKAVEAQQGAGGGVQVCLMRTAVPQVPREPEPHRNRMGRLKRVLQINSAASRQRAFAKADQFAGRPQGLRGRCNRGKRRGGGTRPDQQDGGEGKGRERQGREQSGGGMQAMPPPGQQHHAG